MEIEEIYEIFRFHGLNPEKVKVYEPFYRKEVDAREYRFDYYVDSNRFDYHFLIPVSWQKQSAYEDLMIRAYVVKGVRELSEKLKQPV